MARKMVAGKARGKHRKVAGKAGSKLRSKRISKRSA
jgi:hypothetical protein